MEDAPAHVEDLDDPELATAAGDELDDPDLSRLDELADRMSEVGEDKLAALRFYQELRGG